MNRIAFAIAALFTVGCNEDGLSQITPPELVLEPTIQLDPPSLDFGSWEPGDEDVRVVTITNIGEDILNLDGFVYEGDTSFTVLDWETVPLRLEVDEAAAFRVRFAPETAGPLTGVVWINSDDPENAQARLEMFGQGTGPALSITPNPYDFHSVFVGCDEDVDLTLTNVGDGDLIVSRIGLNASSGQFQLTGSLPLPLTLPPGANATVTVAFDAIVAGTADALLQVISNDPRGEVTATQLAEGTYAGQRIDSFTMPEDPPVDILFAVDQSCSMDGHSANLASNFNTFINSLSAVTSNWQVGVATLQSGCINDTIFRPTTTNLNSRFSAAVSLGSQNDWSEALFLLSQAALAKTAPGYCNAGFLRDDALLHVVLVSDEYEQGNVSAGTFVTNVWNYKDSPSQVRISSIACPAGGCPSIPDGSNSGYAQAVAVGGGELLNILTTDWGASAQILAETSVAGVGRFELSGTPDAGSLTVRLNGTVTTTGWHFNTTTNEVVFDIFPPVGAEIEVTYGLVISCP